MLSLRGDRQPLDVIYLLVDIGLALENTPVLQSQVLEWMKIQAEHGIRVGLVATAIDEERFRETIEPQLDAAGVPHKIIRAGGAASMLARSAWTVRAFRREHGGRNVYVRGIWGAMAHAVAFPIGGPRLVYDFRGDIVAESAYRGSGPFRRSIIDRLVRFSIRRASGVACVSRGAAAVLADRYGRHNATVIPSCVDVDRIGFDPEIRAATRNRLGLRQSDLVLAYAGGISRYQQIPQMLNAWRALSEDRDVKFLLMTNDTPSSDGAPPEQDMAPAGTIILRGLSRADVAAHLMAADIGFMLREAHPLNSVASPVKFAEYLSAGLAVVTSPGIGDVSDLVADGDLGVLVDPEDHAGVVDGSRQLISSIRSDPSAYRRRSCNVARDVLDWKAHLPAWRALLGEPDPAI